MIDPVPDGYLGLDEAVPRLAADISNQETLNEVRHLLEASPASVGKPGTGELAWAKRELAIRKLNSALRDGALIGVVRHPVPSEWFRLTATDWYSAVFWRETILSGCVCASVCEEIERHNGRRVLIEATAFDAWLKKMIQRRPQAANDDCQTWLEREMQANPERTQPKRWWLAQAQEKFGVSERAFDRAWATALKNTRAHWGDAGAPKKLPQ
jgi:hypothetical protein